MRIAGDALDQCRRRIQQTIHGHRGYKDDPLYAARRTLHTGADLLTGRQAQRLRELFAVDEHVAVQATWGIYQRMIAAYRQPDRKTGPVLATRDGRCAGEAGLLRRERMRPTPSRSS